MTLWTPLAVNYFRHPKVASVPPRARLLHLAGFCYCQEHTTDGFIPAGALPVLCAESGASRSAVPELVGGDLWLEVAGGWQVDGWHDWNRYAEDIAESRAKARDRKRKQRERERDGTVTGQSRDVTPPHTHTQSHAENEEQTVEPSLALVPVSAVEPPQLLDDPVRQVFDAWVEATGRTTRALLDAKRRKVIKNALKKYPVEDVIDAVRGWDRSPFHAGDNDRHTVYNELHHLIGDSTKVEKFRDLHRGDAPTGRRKPKSFDRLQAFAASDGSSR